MKFSVTISSTEPTQLDVQQRFDRQEAHSLKVELTTRILSINTITHADTASSSYYSIEYVFIANLSYYIQGCTMDDSAFHIRLAKEKRGGALREFSAGAYSNSADLALKAVEQAIEAVAARNNLHFHVRPRTAHVDRRNWVRGNLPQVLNYLSILWDAYGRLGYGGVDGERARRAIEVMESALNEISKGFGIELI